jgi:hypothetical protein
MNHFHIAVYLTVIPRSKALLEKLTVAHFDILRLLCNLLVHCPIPNTLSSPHPDPNYVKMYLYHDTSCAVRPSTWYIPFRYFAYSLNIQHMHHACYESCIS